MTLFTHFFFSIDRIKCVFSLLDSGIQEGQVGLKFLYRTQLFLLSSLEHRCSLIVPLNVDQREHTSACANGIREFR
jgi:hypothetical protein